ncbi:hypothetical protein KUD11_09985 [Roseovarius sp. LXJ103]|uniref:hypothetical protein n=1 Tax=Roseovarius carneus TaxID=2853164 RepID=UPI000D6039DF|nr:hypothetical protein [Roseovarius carneus]MBZ8118976.1 hypothetical protein [Roseovarius carneus]PWE35371.1 hypothetical protein DD563_04970 [Pelagicola sp. LXJ1103]
MRRPFQSFFVLLAAGTLAACGDTLPEQAIIGAGAGAGTAAVLSGSVLAGAAVGAAGNVAYCQTFPDRC